jgi:predicted lipoprotein with Yx(FWY)xxD motif
MTTRRGFFGILVGAAVAAPVAAKALASAPRVPLNVGNATWDQDCNVLFDYPRTCAAVSPAHRACVKSWPHDGPHDDGRGCLFLLY